MEKRDKQKLKSLTEYPNFDNLIQFLALYFKFLIGALNYKHATCGVEDICLTN